MALTIKQRKLLKQKVQSMVGLARRGAVDPTADIMRLIVNALDDPAGLLAEIEAFRVTMREQEVERQVQLDEERTKSRERLAELDADEVTN